MVKIYVRGSRVIAPSAIVEVEYCTGSKSLVLVCRGFDLIWNFKASHSTFCSSCHFTTHSSLLFAGIYIDIIVRYSSSMCSY